MRFRAFNTQIAVNARRELEPIGILPWVGALSRGRKDRRQIRLRAEVIRIRFSLAFTVMAIWRVEAVISRLFALAASASRHFFLLLASPGSSSFREPIKLNTTRGQDSQRVAARYRSVRWGSMREDGRGRRSIARRRRGSAFGVSHRGIRASLKRPPSKYDEYVCHRSSARIQIFSADRQAEPGDAAGELEELEQMLRSLGSRRMPHARQITWLNSKRDRESISPLSLSSLTRDRDRVAQPAHHRAPSFSARLLTLAGSTITIPLSVSLPHSFRTVYPTSALITVQVLGISPDIYAHAAGSV